VFVAKDFQELYALVSGDQTIDDIGASVDCGIRCDKHCCRPGHTSKYLLPGERAFLEDALAERGDPPFGFASLGYFETIVEPNTRACACEPLRDLRPFNCRIFPYGPRIEGTEVKGLQKGNRKHLEPCWITTPAPMWEKDAVQAWQRILSDEDNLVFFARLATLWEWNQAADRGEDPGHVLVALASLEAASPKERWALCARFFSRSD